MAEPLAEHAAESFQSLVAHGERLVRLAGAHPELLPREGADMAALQIVDHIQAVFDNRELLLDEDGVLGIRRARVRKNGAADLALREAARELQLLQVLRKIRADRAHAPARLHDERK